MFVCPAGEINLPRLTQKYMYTDELYILKHVLSLQNTYTFLFLGLPQHQVLSVTWASPTVGWGEGLEKDKTFGLRYKQVNNWITVKYNITNSNCNEKGHNEKRNKI